MTIQERLRRSNLIMLIVPVVIAGALLVLGLGILALLLQNIYLPQLGLSLRDLHDLGEQAEPFFSGLKLFITLYAIIVLVSLLAAVIFTNLYLTKALFMHIRTPLDALMQGVARIQNGDLDTPIAYAEADEFRPACDAVDEMAARLKESLAAQQKEQQKKQELIAGMSHDLKSPLTTIRAYTEALLDDIAHDEATRQRYLQTIYAKETDLEALVNRLFELAKLGASEYPVHLCRLPLGETLQNILDDCDRDEISLSCHIAQRSGAPVGCGSASGFGATSGSSAASECGTPSECYISADPELLRRILYNLIDNSCKYGATHLSLSAEAGKSTVTIRVQDDGPGVPSEQLPKLFEPFFRGDAARTRPASGSGLGLAVVRRSVQQMGGEVRAENAPEGGLVILLTLPVATDHAAV